MDKLEQQRNDSNASTNQVTKNMGVEESAKGLIFDDIDLYPGEQLDFIISLLTQIKEKCAKCIKTNQHNQRIYATKSGNIQHI